MGAKFLRVAEDADGSGVGGYAKEMSDDYKSKEASKVSEWVSEADIIITTALIPGIYTYILYIYMWYIHMNTQTYVQIYIGPLCMYYPRIYPCMYISLYNTVYIP